MLYHDICYDDIRLKTSKGNGEGIENSLSIDWQVIVTAIVVSNIS